MAESRDSSSIGRKLAPWLVVIAVGLASNAWLHHRIVGALIKPRFDHPALPLQERTFGQNVLFVFDILDFEPQPDTKYFFLIGDSTVISGLGDKQPRTLLAFQLGDLLKEEYGDGAKLVLLSYPGLLIEDAVLFVAEALARGADVVYYALNPRIFADTNTARMSRLGLGNRVSGLALARDGARWIPPGFYLRRFSPETLANGVVRGRFHFVSDASAVRYAIADWCAARSDEHNALIDACLRVFPVPRFVPPPPPKSSGDVRRFVYGNADYTFEGAPAEAFELLLDLCEESGKCLLYHTPINTSPACARYFEPGLLDRYYRYTEGAGLYAQPHFADYTHVLPSAQFSGRDAVGCDALHPGHQGRRALATLLLNDTRGILEERR